MPMLALLGLTALLRAVAQPACTDSGDCSLLGECVNGHCRCDKGFVDPPGGKGPPCSYFRLGTAEPASPGYHNASFPSWGGAPVQWTEGEGADGQWHLFTPQFANGCDVDYWLGQSFVVHAVGPSPVGPWSHSDVALPPYAHGSQVVIDPVSGLWIMFFVGGWHTQPDTWHNCSFASPVAYPPPGEGPGVGRTVDGCGPTGKDDRGCGIYLATATTPYGPWTVHNVTVENTWKGKPTLLDCNRGNPAPYMLPNGTVVVAFTGGGCHGGLETIGVMRASSWRGPYTLTSLNPIASAKGCPSSQLAEDPFLWHDGKRGWHIIAHGLCDWRTPSHNGTDLYGLMAWSRDLETWEIARDPGTGLPSLPWSKNVQWSNGSTTYVSRMERPQLVLAPPLSGRGTGSQPLYLSTAVCPGGSSVGSTACHGKPSWGLYRPIVH